MGRIAAPYAVRGWVKIQPFSEDLDALLDHPVWHIGKASHWQTLKVIEAKIHGQSLVAQLQGVNDRSAAEAMQGMEVAVQRAELPPAGADEFYWDDLIGLEVVNLSGESLGKVEGLLETGAHDVLKVNGDRERLIPFKAPIVGNVDLEAGRLEVDWGLDW